MKKHISKFTKNTNVISSSRHIFIHVKTVNNISHLETTALTYYELSRYSFENGPLQVKATHVGRGDTFSLYIERLYSGSNIDTFKR